MTLFCARAPRKGRTATDTRDLERKLREESAFDEDAVLGAKAPQIHALINGYLADKNLSQAEVIRKLNVERSYGYQLLNGRRVPTREQLIKLGFLFGLDLEEMQRFLKTAGKPVLYVRSLTDARVFYAVEHGFDFDRACEFVWGE